MKHHRATRLALLSTLAAAFTMPALAQQPTATLNESVSTTATAPRPDAPPPPRHGGPDGKPHQGPRGDRLLHGVELTQEQRSKISALREAAAPQMREAMASAMTARKALRDLTLAPTFDENRAQQLAQEAAAAQAKAAVLRAKTEHQILAVLTPEQRTALETRRKEAEARAQQRRAEHRESRGERGERGAERRAAPEAAPAAGATPAAPAEAPAPATPAAR